MGLALGDGWSDQRPPRWPLDPDYPQQLHVDVAVPDLVAGGELVTRLGGRSLEDFDDHRFVAPRWPDPANPAQLHVDWRFTDGADPAVERAERLGGIRVSAKGRQFVDPAGHPLCL